MGKFEKLIQEDLAYLKKSPAQRTKNEDTDTAPRKEHHEVFDSLQELLCENTPIITTIEMNEKEPNFKTIPDLISAFS